MILISIIIITTLVYVDQYTKKRARIELQDKSYETNGIKFSLVKNHGAFRGLLKDNPLILLGIQIIGVFAVLVFLLIQLFGKKDKLFILGLDLLLAGALGNLIDRITNKYVTDFFAIKWTKDLYYNLADMFIFIGAIISLFRGK